jgi:hypothetical protein
MVVVTVGQMIKPELAVESPMATDPKVAGDTGAPPSEGFTGMLADFQGIQERTNNSLTKGYFMDGGAMITGYNGCAPARLCQSPISFLEEVHNHPAPAVLVATN